MKLAIEPEAPPRAGWVAFGALVQLLFAGTVPVLYWFLLLGASQDPVGETTWRDALVDVALVGLFAVPHSFFLHPSIRRRIGVPRPLFGSFFCLVAVVTLAALIGFWRPLPGIVWKAEGEARVALAVANALAWGCLLYSMWLSGLGYQTGLDGVVAYARGRPMPPRTFEPRGAYRVLRHPIYLSFLLIAWLTPTMTVAHLILSVGFTVYTYVGSVLKDRRLLGYVGEPYRRYMEAVPGYPMIPAGPLARVLVFLGALLIVTPAHAQELAVDPAASDFHILVKKKGALKAFAHDHDIAARISTGVVVWNKERPQVSSVSIKIKSKDIEVLDPGLSQTDKDEVARITRSSDVLDADRYPEVVFESQNVTPLDDENGKRVLSVAGRLTLHGVTRQISMKVRFVEKERGLEVEGEYPLTQTDYGIEPYSAMFGAVGVQDVVTLRWKVVARREVAK